ncbi:MAG: hypothetical protein UZ21_OP11001000259 [Microgenomates bacterium OLB22]|nr:MAG: hypothetical protein UZ21_OP11001000259 [Microgenomates bacterium OLB22]
MTKNPIINALSATAYIIIVANVMFYIMDGVEDTILIPIFVLSLLTLSALVMGYVFFLQPVLLYLEGNKKDAVTLFGQSIGAFATITLVILGLVASGVLR